MNLTKMVSNTRLISLLVFLSLALLLPTDGGSIAAFAVMLLMSFVYLFMVKDKPALDGVDKLFIFTLVFMFLTVLPTFISDGFRGRYLDISLRDLLAVPILLLLLYTTPRASWLFAGAVVGSIAAFLLAIYQYYYLGWDRVDGFLYSINFGYLACALAFISLAAAIYFERIGWKIASIVAFVSVLFAMMLTGTRGAFIAMPVLLVMFVFIYRKELGTKLLLLMVALTISLPVASYLAVPAVQERFDKLFTELSEYESSDKEKAYSSTGVRLELWKAATAAFKKSPVYGLNYNQREGLNAQLAAEGKIIPQILDISRGHAHNEYFEALAGRGALGLIALLMLFFVPGVVFLRKALSTQGKEKALATAGVTFIAGFMVYGISEVPLQGNVISGCYALTVVVIYAMLKHPEKSLV